MTVERQKEREIKMKEFKFCGEMTEYVEIPVYVCETQKEMVKEISEIRDVLTFVDEARENLLDTAVSNEEETSVYIIYKDGSIYFKTLDEEKGKFKRYGIKAGVIETAYEYTVFGDFAVTDNGDISIEENDIEEYGIYAGQYDVKEQDEQEAVEQTEVEETAETDDSGFEYYSVETAYEVDFRDRQNEVFKTYSEAEKTAGDNIILEVDLIVRNDKKAVSEHDKEVFEDETDEIECRCIWYHHNGVKGMIAQDTKRVIKKSETDNKGGNNNE